MQRSRIVALGMIFAIGAVLGGTMISGCGSAGIGAEVSPSPSAAAATLASGDGVSRPGSAKPYASPGENAEFFEFQRRRIDGADVSPAHVHEALREIRDRQRDQELARGGGPGGVLGWSELGPGNIGGRTRTLVIDPQNPSVMYAGATSGGIWKTVDGGASWVVLDDMMANLAVTSIVMDPTDSSVLYAGTGEGFFFGTGPAGRGFGIFKSVDAGATWTQLPGTANASFFFVNELVISESDPQRVYAGTRTGVWRTTNGGASWELVLANPNAITAPGVQNTVGCTVGCTDMVIRTDGSPDVLFASFGSFQPDGLYRSSDGGDTWLQYSVPTQQGRMSLALAPSDNDVVYISMADNGSGGQTGRLVQLYRSIDGGDSFTAQADLENDPFAPNLLTNMVIALGCFEYMDYSQGWYDNALAVDPIDPDVVWVGGIALSRSDDGGATWGRASYYFGYSNDDPVWVHPDFHGVFFHPGYDGVGNQTMFVTNDGGLFKTDNALGAVSTELCPSPPGSPTPEIGWETLNNGYAVTQFYHGDSSPQIDLFIGGAQDNGTSAAFSASDPNGWLDIFGGDGGYVAIDPTNPNVIYVEIQFFPEIRKSVNGGASFFDAVNGITDTDGLFITPFAMDQNNPQVLWTGGSRPWRTLNGAASWRLARNTAFPVGGKISAIGISPSDSNTVYLGLSNGRVFRSTDALAPSPVWTQSAGVQGLVNGAFVSSVAVHPTDPDIAYLSYSNYGIAHVYRTLNGGSSWTAINGTPPDNLPDIPAHWVAVRPSNPDQLYAATELAVFGSDDGGESWRPIPGIPNTIVETLDFQTDDRLVAFTHGRGAWRAALASGEGCNSADLVAPFGVLDFSDVSAFLGAFGAVHSSADLAPPFGVFDFGDVLAFLTAFGSGCP